MTKQDLKSGMIVELRNGNNCLILENNCSSEGKSVFKKWSCVCHLERYNDDLTHEKNKDYDIVKVSTFYNSAIANLEAFACGYKPTWQWERKEPKELTVSEIEKLLGYPVKIVKE